MSSFIVGSDTITAIVDGLEEFDVGIYDERRGTWTHARREFMRAGQMLADMNYRQVNYRYGDEAAGHFSGPGRFKPVDHAEKKQRLRSGVHYVTAHGYTYGDIVGCVRCYEYQCDENDEWRGSGIHQALLDLLAYLATAVCGGMLGQNVPYGIGGHDLAD